MGIFNFGVSIFLRLLSWYVIIVRMVCSNSQNNCILRTLFTILYYKRSLDLCAAYYNYFAALTQILCAPCNTEEISGSYGFPPPATPQEPMVALLIRCPLKPVPPSYPSPIRSVCSVRPIQTASSQFLPIYQLLHKNPTFLSKLEQTNTIQLLL